MHLIIVHHYMRVHHTHLKQKRNDKTPSTKPRTFTFCFILLGVFVKVSIEELFLFFRQLHDRHVVVQRLGEVLLHVGIPE